MGFGIGAAGVKGLSYSLLPWISDKNVYGTAFGLVSSLTGLFLFLF